MLPLAHRRDLRLLRLVFAGGVLYKQCGERVELMKLENSKFLFNFFTNVGA